MFPETSGKLFRNFLSQDPLVTKELTRMLHLQKVQFYDWKQGLYFNKSRKVYMRKFPREKTLPESMSYNFVKFQKFFPTGEHFGKFRGSVLKPLIIKV